MGLAALVSIGSIAASLATVGTSINTAVQDAPKLPDPIDEEATARRESARRVLALQRQQGASGGGRRVLASMTQESALLPRPVLTSVNR